MTLATDEILRSINEIKLKMDRIISLLEDMPHLRFKNAQDAVEFLQYQRACTCHKKGQTAAVEACPLPPGRLSQRYAGDGPKT